jgi:hypothetical protein
MEGDEGGGVRGGHGGEVGEFVGLSVHSTNRGKLGVGVGSIVELVSRRLMMILMMMQQERKERRKEGRKEGIYV